MYIDTTLQAELHQAFLIKCAYIHWCIHKLYTLSPVLSSNHTEFLGVDYRIKSGITFIITSVVLQILEKGEMLYLTDELEEHFQNKIIPTILQSQASTNNTPNSGPDMKPLSAVETSIAHVVEKLQGHSIQRVIVTCIAACF